MDICCNTGYRLEYRCPPRTAALAASGHSLHLRSIAGKRASRIPRRRISCWKICRKFRDVRRCVSQLLGIPFPIPSRDACRPASYSAIPLKKTTFPLALETAQVLVAPKGPTTLEQIYSIVPVPVQLFHQQQHQRKHTTSSKDLWKTLVATEIYGCNTPCINIPS